MNLFYWNIFLCCTFFVFYVNVTLRQFLSLGVLGEDLLRETYECRPFVETGIWFESWWIQTSRLYRIFVFTIGFLFVTLNENKLTFDSGVLSEWQPFAGQMKCCAAQRTVNWHGDCTSCFEHRNIVLEDVFNYKRKYWHSVVISILQISFLSLFFIGKFIFYDLICNYPVHDYQWNISHSVLVLKYKCIWQDMEAYQINLCYSPSV